MAAALALGRKGYRITVCERRSDANEAGAGLQISPNASHILLNWGLAGQLANAAVAPTELAIRRWSEPRAFARMPFREADDGVPHWVLLRADLHRALTNAALATGAVELRTGWALESMRQTTSGVAIELAAFEHRQTIEADAIIGADGQRSRLRQLLGDARELDRPGWEAWRTLIPNHLVPDFIRAAATNLWLGRDSHAVHYPVASGKQINLVIIRRSTSEADGWSRAGDAHHLQGLAASAAPTLRELMGQAPEWSVWTLRDRAPALRLSTDRAVLVGDAAHPMLPFLAQGGALAIEDAAVLAALLPPAPAASVEKLALAFSRYATQRQSRVTKVWKTARANAFTYHLSGPLAWLRDRRIVQLGPDGMRQRYSWLYDWRMPREGS
jgi:salicylate hydroxylase